MQTLLQRLESLTAPSREVDAEIALSIPGFCAPTAHYDAKDDCLVWHEYHEHGLPGAHLSQELPRFTASIDAALLGKPDGFYWRMTMGRELPDAALNSVVLRKHDSAEIFAQAEHDTPAIALCIAIVKARGGVWRPTPLPPSKKEG